MGILESPVADLTVALTNGTDDSAVNAEGNYEMVVSVGTDYGLSGLRTSVGRYCNDMEHRRSSAG